MSGTVVLAFVGCGPSAQEQQQAKERAEFRDVFVRRDVEGESARQVAHPKRLLVAQGRSPVVFELHSPAKAHVMDLTSGAELAATDVDINEIVSVSEDAGVSVGRRRIVPGPLAAGHEFGISLDLSDEESFRSRISTEPIPSAQLKPYRPAAQPVDPPHGQVGNP